jgi:hypothetical protein
MSGRVCLYGSSVYLTTTLGEDDHQKPATLDAPNLAGNPGKDELVLHTRLIWSATLFSAKDKFLVVLIDVDIRYLDYRRRGGVDGPVTARNPTLGL